jgi:DNA polymerase III alpha subunit
MASFRQNGKIETHKRQFIEGMVKNGYTLDFAQSCFAQIEGFGEYGFPESHAQAFGWLAYVSSWMKCHHPAAFTCALLNSQPMGFTPPRNSSLTPARMAWRCAPPTPPSAHGTTRWKARASCAWACARSTASARNGPRRW